MVEAEVVAGEHVPNSPVGCAQTRVVAPSSVSLRSTRSPATAVSLARGFAAHHHDCVTGASVRYGSPGRWSQLIQVVRVARESHRARAADRHPHNSRLWMNRWPLWRDCSDDPQGPARPFYTPCRSQRTGVTSVPAPMLSDTRARLTPRRVSGSSMQVRMSAGDTAVAAR
jgi:hypothetical protein